MRSIFHLLRACDEAGVGLGADDRIVFCALHVGPRTRDSLLLLTAGNANALYRLLRAGVATVANDPQRKGAKLYSLPSLTLREEEMARLGLFLIRTRHLTGAAVDTLAALAELGGRATGPEIAALSGHHQSYLAIPRLYLSPTGKRPHWELTAEARRLFA